MKALQMLTNYVNRSLAERKLVIKVIEENREAEDLGAAFETLMKQSDSPRIPIEPYVNSARLIGKQERT